MRAFTKKDFPVSQIRRFLEPGPIVLVSSAWKGETNIMTMGWHTVMEFQPSLVGCMISSGNHSFGMIQGQQGMRDQHPDLHWRSRWSASAIAQALTSPSLTNSS